MVEEIPSAAAPGRRRIRPRLRIVAAPACVVVLIGLNLLVPEVRYYTRVGLQSLGIGNARPHFVAHTFEADGRLWLWGGSVENAHFDITTFRLTVEGLKHGRGRHSFPGLVAPEFMTVEQADRWLVDESPVIAVRIEGEVKVYPVRMLAPHEIVNDEVGGRPVLVAWCPLAHLGAVYEPRSGEQRLTFAASGYTYRDEAVWGGREAFVLWDRETESLWWPPLGVAVSGPMIDEPMRVLESGLWAQMTWSAVRATHSGAAVLSLRQRERRPESWPRLVEPPRNSEMVEPVASIAPRWGGNPQLGAP
jgi:hypothetical protein